MGKKLRKYLKETDQILCMSEHTKTDMDWANVLKEHQVQIGFYQHERLIHLLVTLTFAALAMAVFILNYIKFSLGLFVLFALLLILLVPYIFHYFLLENGVQKMYGQYDVISKKMRETVHVKSSEDVL